MFARYINKPWSGEKFDSQNVALCPPVKVFMELVFISVTNKIAGSGNVRANLPYCINSETDQFHLKVS